MDDKQYQKAQPTGTQPPANQATAGAKHSTATQVPNTVSATDAPPSIDATANYPQPGSYQQPAYPVTAYPQPNSTIPTANPAASCPQGAYQQPAYYPPQSNCPPQFSYPQPVQPAANYPQPNAAPVNPVVNYPQNNSQQAANNFAQANDCPQNSYQEAAQDSYQQPQGNRFYYQQQDNRTWQNQQPEMQSSKTGEFMKESNHERSDFLNIIGETLLSPLRWDVCMKRLNWWVGIFIIIILIILTSSIFGPSSFLTFIIELYLLYSFILIDIRRLKDSGHSPAWFAISLFPLIGGIILLFMLGFAGSDTAYTDNKYLSFFN